MKWQTLMVTMLVAGLPYGLDANAPPPAPPSSAPEVPSVPAPPLPTVTGWVPCDGPGGTGHQVTVFSEGTAWNRGRKAAWLTVYNPESTAQDVWVQVFVDGVSTPLELYTRLEGHTRFAWLVNQEVKKLDARPNKDFNFATEVFFERQGAANLAVWELGESDHGYVRASYLKGTERCVTW